MNLRDADAQQIDPRTLSGHDALELELVCRQRISLWWIRADLEPSFPIRDGDVAALLQAVEYAIDDESLARFLIAGQFGDVAISESRRWWSGTDVVRLATFLEARRAWQPGSELHRAKKTHYELALEHCRETGEAHELFNDLERFDLRSLLLLMTEADARQMREALFVAIQIKMEGFEIIV